MTVPVIDDQPTPEQLDALYTALSNWGRWGADDELGALNFLTPERRAAAGALVHRGLTVSLAHDFPVNPSPETPSPAHHHMLASGDARDSNGIPGYEASRDYIGTEVHGMGITHLDALCHMFVRGEMYNGRPAGDVKSTGALSNTVMVTAERLAGRGVFLDIPRARGVDALDGNAAITVADLERAEGTQGSSVRSGDLLIVGGGRDARRTAQGGRFDPFRDGMAGLHPQCLPWLHEREVALLMGDGISDMTPGLGIANWPFPVHQIGITGMGLHLVDNVNLARLARVCADEARWEFLCVVAPLRIPGGTGCPVNPIAIF
jgi:kynurenine formamidase